MSKLYTLSLARRLFFTPHQVLTYHSATPPPSSWKILYFHTFPSRCPRPPKAEKGPETEVPPAGFLRPGIRRHKGPAGSGPRWQGLSLRGNVLRPLLAESGLPETRVVRLLGQALCTWGPRAGDSTPARGDLLHSAGPGTCFPVSQNQHH